MVGISTNYYVKLVGVMDKNEIISILNEWNFWKRDFPVTFEREIYEKDFNKKIGLGEIIFLKGVRRSGKSTLLINFIKSLIKKGIPKESLLIVNLEDPRFATNLNLNLLEDIKNAFIYYLEPKEKPYIFLDEIQNIPQFEKWLLKEYELKTSYLVATGSNSKLLSKEIGSTLSGRYFDIEVMPLSFKEFLKFKNINVSSSFDIISQKNQLEKLFEEFVYYGGFPKVVLIDDNEIKNEELKIYFDSILLRDIVARYNLDNFRALEQISVILLSSIANPISISSLKKSLKISYDLVNNYIDYLENAYLIFRIPLFSWSYRKQQANPKKVYSIDTGLARNVCFQIGKKKGDFLENIVFLELRRKFNEIYYFKTSQGYEVDFLIKEKEKIIYLIQVSLTLKDEKVKKREIRSLLKAKKELEYTDDTKLMIITTDESKVEKVENVEIEIVNVIEWLLR